MEDIGLLENGGVYDNDNLPHFYNGKSISCILKSGNTFEDCKIIVNIGKKIPNSATFDVE